MWKLLRICPNYLRWNMPKFASIFTFNNCLVKNKSFGDDTFVSHFFRIVTICLMVSKSGNHRAFVFGFRRLLKTMSFAISNRHKSKDILYLSVEKQPVFLLQKIFPTHRTAVMHQSFRLLNRNNKPREPDWPNRF